MSNSKSPSSSKDGSKMQTATSRTQQEPVLVAWVPWCPVSESNRRDHWSARHRRSKAAKEAWRNRKDNAHGAIEFIRVMLELGSRSLPSDRIDSTTTTSQVGSRRSGTPSPKASASTMGTNV